MIFIVGNSRSGTTMMARILGRNKDAKVFRELHFFEEIWSPKLNDKFLSGSMSKRILSTLLSIQRDGYMAKRELSKWGPETEAISRGKDLNAKSAIDILDIFLKNELALDNALVGVEQTPRNVFYLKEIAIHFPDALIIELIRDPRDVLFSKKNKWKRGFLGGDKKPLWAAALSWANYHPVITAKLWRSAIRAGQSFTGSAIKRISFELLIQDPEPVIMEICKQANLVYDKNMLDVDQIGSSLRADSTTRGINSQANGRWREGGLTATEIYICQRETKAEMNHLGYELITANPNVFGLVVTYAILPIKLFVALIMNFNRLASIKEAIQRRFKSA
jgi:hypothetical protein